MKQHFKRGFLPILLCLLFLIACVGCSSGTSNKESSPSESDSSISDKEHSSTRRSLANSSQFDSDFTLNYNPDVTFNPITSTNIYNQAVDSFVYEGLFVLDKNLSAQKVLCKSYNTSDGITYNFKLEPNVVFHDGTPLTAEDISYSLTMAEATDKYSSRLSCISEIIVIDELTLQIILYEPNYRLPELLDIPIIPDGTIDNDAPAGTGPYQFNNKTALKAFIEYRNTSAHPIESIRLISVKDTDLANDFSSHKIDMLPTNLSDIDNLVLNINYDTNYYNTTVLQYIGFNLENPILENTKLRQAIDYAINRDEIVSFVMDQWAVPAPLILNSSLSYYDFSWEKDAGYQPEKATRLLSEAGLKDSDQDGFLEILSDGVMVPFTLRLLVNEENQYKSIAADEIVVALQELGINITLESLPWEEYVLALQEGKFDLYYAETRLCPDFDLTEIFSDEGSLNFGGISDETYTSLIQRYKGASTDERLVSAAADLCSYVRKNCQIVPVLYKQSAVLTHQGVVFGIAASPSTYTGDLSQWRIVFDS